MTEGEVAAKLVHRYCGHSLATARSLVSFASDDEIAEIIGGQWRQVESIVDRIRARIEAEKLKATDERGDD